LLIAPVVLSAAAAADARAADDEAGVLFFESKIRPLLAEHCYKCHSARAEKLKGMLRLDSREELLRGGEGGVVVVPGKPEQSRLIQAVVYENPDLQMPPKARLSREQVADLTQWVRMGAPWPGEVAQAVGPTSAPAADLMQRKAGHWAWQPVRATEPPPVKNGAWPRGAVDRFILAKLEASGLEPAPPADHRSLLRRVYFVLTGLPPTPEEVEAFLSDPSSRALENLVDRLLASPRFGEQWARHWMDLVRYSDTLGNEADMPIHNGWRYRDYLIRAFNADLPLDRLIVEHVAGDLMGQPRRDPATGLNESVVGTAFYWMNEGKRSPVDLRLAQAEAFDNRLDVIGKAFLGLTIACARCHDHKFDPIAQEDYYGLYGFLKSSRYTQAALNAPELDAKAAELKALREQIRQSAAASLQTRAATVSRYLMAAKRVEVGSLADAPAPQRIARTAEAVGLDPARLGRWVAAMKEVAADPSHPLYAWRRISDLGHEPTPESTAERWQDVVQKSKAHQAAPAKASRREGDIEIADFAAAGFDRWFVEDQAFGDAPLRPGDFLIGSDASRPIATFVRGGAWAHSGHLSRRLQGTLRSPTFDIGRRYLHVLAAGRASRMTVVIDHFVMIQDPLYGSLRRIVNDEGPRWVTFDLGMWKGRQAYVEFADSTTQDLHDMRPPDGCGREGHVAVGRAVLSDQGAPAAPSPTAVARLLGDEPIDSLDGLAERYQRAIGESLGAFGEGKLAEAKDAEARATLLAWLVERGLLDGPDTRLDELFKRYHEIERNIPDAVRAPAMTDGPPENEYVFLRGNPRNAGQVVPRRLPSALAGDRPPTTSARGSGRLAVARGIVDPANPLTGRVMVNRIWHHVFGRGIVPSVDNFGAMGDRPSHPELLDYLADRFVKEGWSAKRLIRELVLSSTFQMSSSGSQSAEEKDPDNRLLHRMPVRRLDAEEIRDSILAVSGRLEREKMFGPGVEVYLTPFMENGYSGEYGRPKGSGPLDGEGRRSVYLMVRRNFMNPMLVAFDFPPPLNTAGRRTVSNVPAQALILLNDPFVIEQAKRWAKRIVAREADAPARIRRMYQETFARPPSEEEVTTAMRFVERHGEELGIPAEKREVDVRLWGDLAHVLINVKEFIFLK
jgi:hypothetical protein